MLGAYNGGTQLGGFNGGSIYTPNNLKVAWGLGKNLGKGLKRKADEYFKSAPSRKKVKFTGKTRNRGSSAGFRENKSDQISIAGNDSKSYYTSIKKTKTNLGKLEQVPQIIVNNTSGRLSCSPGVQQWATLGTYYDRSDLNQQITLAGGAAAFSFRIMIRSIMAKAMITNQESANCYATLYDIVPKRDGNTTVPDPLTLIQAGYADNNGGAATNYTVPGTTPWSNPRFTEFFTIKNITPIVIGPGSTHSHNVHYAPNKLISHELDNFITGGIKGVSMYTLIQFHGSPVNDITTKTQVSLSSIALDYVLMEEYKFAYTAQNYAAASIVNSLPLAFTTAGNVMEDDGNIRPDTAA